MIVESRPLSPDQKSIQNGEDKIDVKGTCTCWWVKVRPLLDLVLLLQYRN